MATPSEQPVIGTPGQPWGDAEKAQWRAEDVLGLLTELSELAQLAESQGQVLFVWMCVVR